MDTAKTLTFMRIVTTAAKGRASDLHLSVGSRPMMRIDGQLQAIVEEDVITEVFIKEVLSTLLSVKELENLEKNREHIFTHVFEGKLRAKINIYYQEGMLALSLRFLDVRVKTFRELDVPQSFSRLLELKRGLVIIGGEYGSGRTTLAVALLEEINRQRAEHIVTIESPIEYDLGANKSIIDQREVGQDVASFKEGLAYVQHGDVDVLFVSGLTEKETTLQALEIANGGILTIAIVDAESSVRALEKLVTFFEEFEQQHVRGLLSDSLEAIVIQRLVPKLGGGMAPAHEVLYANDAVRSMVVANRFSQIDTIIAASKTEGMVGMEQSLANLVHSGIISTETARQSTAHHEVLERLLSA